MILFIMEGWITVAAPLDAIPLHIAGGSVLPLQYPGKTNKILVLSRAVLGPGSNASS